MPKATAFNAKADKSVQELTQRLIKPTSEKQIDRDFATLATLPPPVRLQVLETLEAEALKEIREAATPENLDVLKQFQEHLSVLPQMLDENAVQKYLKSAQLGAFTLARLEKERQAQLPAELKLYARQLEKMSDEDFSNPSRHIEALVALLESLPPEEPKKNPFRKSPAEKDAEATVLQEDLKLKKPLNLKK